MKCPSCGKESTPGAKFCESCGTPLALEQPAVVNGQQYAQAPPQGQQQAPPQYGAQPNGEQPQYGQPQQQYGPPPQYGAQPQYGQPQQQYGPPPQYGAQPYGAQPQYGPQPYGQPMYPQGQVKNAGIAAVLAFLIAGLGHIYLGLVTKGIMYIIIMVVLWVVGVFTWGIGFIIYIVFWLWQIYDAYNKANQYNAALQQTGRAPW